MIHAFHAPALFLALTLGAGPASAVVTFDLTDTRAAELIAICEAEDGAPWTHSDSPAVVNCCIPGQDWCVVCTAGTPEDPTGCMSLGVPPVKPAE
ncbi:hypothetical protein KZZ07_19860 [Mameliella sp. CS4]|uniref:hypothetical protein n=1 Tax=Mameliella sp. CS4 TaxID=2862329 RepID=UPI001C5D1094|nr:hypothetical protein [Mameliella sp. CS4]MBW4984801.1 hypothetical protein [Mameliella sp. CS4]